MDNNNQKPRSLYALWLETNKNGALPQEWRLAHNFLTWATANGYKVEYGYKGEFTPDNLKQAIQGAETERVPDPVCELVNNNTLAALKEMAKGIDLGKATRKEDIARLIVDSGILFDPEVSKDAGE